MKPRQIALLSDFGQSDPYVGIMKSIINHITPGLCLIDLTHQIPPGDIQSGAFHLWQSAPYFPPDTIFLAVVDPGVGSNRKGLYFQRKEQVFIGPDNGLFSYLGFQTETRAWELSNSNYQLQHLSSTFHGRDIFAPAVAFAAQATQGKQFGKSVKNPVQLPRPHLRVESNKISGEIIHRDHFGNLITSLGKFQRKNTGFELISWLDGQRLVLPSQPTVLVEKSGVTLPLVSTYHDIPDGSCAGLIGSSGLLEIAANQTSAAELLELGRGSSVTFIWK